MGSRVHPAWIAIGVIRWLRGLALPLLFAVVSGGSLYSQLFYVIAGAVGLLAGAARFIEWTRLRYAVSGDELRVSSGLLSREERTVPLKRIQSVELRESLLQRLFGVVGITIETAAGGSKNADVELAALSRADALALRDRLRPAARRAASPPADGIVAAAGSAAVSEPPLIRALSTRDLLVTGATSARIGPALAVVVGALQVVDDIARRPLPALLGIDAPSSPSGLMLLLLIFTAGAWLLAIGSTVLTYAGFELRRDGDRLLVSHGLLDRRRRSVPLARIQAVRVTENPLRQPFGLAGLGFESAGYGRDAADSGVLFPLLPLRDVANVLAAAHPALAVEQPWAGLERPSARARLRYVTAPVWPMLALTLATYLVAVWSGWFSPWWVLAPIAALPVVAVLGLLTFRDSGWRSDTAGRLIVRGRALSRATTITLGRRLQWRAVSRSPLQRRARLATFRAAVAGGGSRPLALAHLDEAVAFALAQRPDPFPIPTRRGEGSGHRFGVP